MRVDAVSAAALRDRIGMKAGRAAIFCGRLYDRKRIDFLLEASGRIRERIPDFDVSLATDPTPPRCARLRSRIPGCITWGCIFIEEIVPYFELADVCLMPGAVGLTILDTFALETPLITTRLSDHGPEIEYLRPEQNGIDDE